MAVVNRAILVITFLLCIAGATHAADSLSWNTNKARVTADVQNWDLITLLENVGTATGWEIYVEPKTRHQASVKFKERAPGEALRMLLGNLSYALLPQTNAPSKLYVFRNTRNDATQLVRRKKSGKLDKELIITLKPGGNLDTNALGAKVTGKIDKLNAYRLEFKDAAAAEEARKKLEQDENVDLVDSNYDILRPPDSEALSMSAIPGLDLKIKPNESGGGPIIGLIDTAIQKQPGREGFYLPGISVGGDATLFGDVPSHGTAMAEAILRGLGMLKDGGDVSGARILPVDIYGDAASSSTFQLVQGILKALENDARILNLSLGSNAGNELLRRVISEAASQGILFFAAAGNEPTTTPTFPAAYEGVLAVTAVDRSGNIAPYANRGSFVDIGAPGSVIVPYNGQSFVVMGTSPATAWATGAATALMASGVPTESIPGKMGNLMAPPSAQK